MTNSLEVKKAIDLLNEALHIYETKPWHRRKITFRIECAIRELESIPASLVERNRPYVSVHNLNDLNVDCLLHILQYLSFQDLLRLRPFCALFQSVIDNEILYSKKTMKIFGSPMDPLMFGTLNHIEQEIFPFLRMNVRDDRVFLRRRPFSFVDFLKRRMPNITELVLYLEESDAKIYPDIISHLPNISSLFVLFPLSVWSTLKDYKQNVMAAILHLKNLRTLCLQTDNLTFDILRDCVQSGCLNDGDLKHLKSVSIHVCNDNAILQRVFPPESELEELHINIDNTMFHPFVNLQNLTKLYLTSCDVVMEFFSSPTLRNLSVLHLNQNTLNLTPEVMRLLQSLSKLEELLLASVTIRNDVSHHQNNTIQRLILVEPSSEVAHLNSVLRTFEGLQTLTLEGDFDVEHLQAHIWNSHKLRFRKFSSTKYLPRNRLV